VWRDYPLPRDDAALLAAEAARAAFADQGEAGYWKFHDALFAEAARSGILDRSVLERIARDQGLDLGAFRRALDTRQYRPLVEADVRLGKDIGVVGTPYTVVGRYVVSGALPERVVERAIERALKDK
jgi:predicted DsbA family dithiol-disulfide isomerase